ncbi:MAG TPA: DoxX family protein [Thermoanaerobaculia bacterium]|nr:DoxX family protein [Thermoanaerobaculia bacterium]
MLERLMPTDTNLGSPLLRLFLGVVFFPHGAQKLLGWFGGQGFGATVAGMSHLGLPAALVFLVILIEFFGALGLLLGFLTRLSASGILCVMLGAIFTVHLKNGFFMNWTGQQYGEGFEYHLLVIGMCLALMVLGGGRYSVDGSMGRGRAAAGTSTSPSR